jgi:sugar lactone lactonase YvrE
MVTDSALDTFGGGPALTFTETAGASGTTWALQGAGTLSATQGAQITYTPPATVSADTQVSLVATLGALSKNEIITLHAPVLSPVARQTNWYVGDGAVTLTALPRFTVAPVAWSSSGGGSFDSTSGDTTHYTPPNVTVATLVTISAAANGHTESVTITLAPASEKNLNLSSASVQAGSNTVTLTVPASITHGTLIWNASIGMITVNADGSATYTPPATLSSATVAQISASDGVNAPLIASITITPSATLSVTPSSGTTSATGSPVSLSATVANSSASVQWAVTSGHGSVTPATGPTVSYVPDPTDTTPNDTAVVTATLGNLSQTVQISLNFQSTARFNAPQGVAVDNAGNVYVADYSNNEIRKITPSGVVSTLAGSTTHGSVDGTGSAASFFLPQAIAVDSSGNVYVADTFNNEIRKVTPQGVVTTLAGSTSAGFADGPAASAKFNLPSGLVVDASGTIYIADTSNNKIRKLQGGVVSTVAGTGAFGNADGPAASAAFDLPQGLAEDASGNLYIADSGNYEIRELSGGQVTTLAGMPLTGHADGPALSASFYMPTGIAVDASGNIYIADNGNSELRLLSGGVVTTLAGSYSGRGNTDGLGSAARFAGPNGLAMDISGNLYVVDTNNNEIRLVTPAGSVSTLAGYAAPGNSDGTALPR